MHEWGIRLQVMLMKNPALQEAKKFWGKTPLSGRGFLVKGVYTRKGLNKVFVDKFLGDPAARKQALARLVEKAMAAEEKPRVRSIVDEIVGKGGDIALWGAVGRKLLMRHTVGSKLSDTMARHEEEIGRLVYSRYIEPQIRSREEEEAARVPAKQPKFPERKVTQEEMRKAFEGLVGRRLEKEEKKVPTWISEALGKKPSPTGHRSMSKAPGEADFIGEMKAMVGQYQEALQKQKPGERQVTVEDMRRAFEGLIGRRLALKGEKLSGTVREHLGVGAEKPSGLRFSITPSGSVLPEDYLKRMKAFVAELKKEKKD